MERTTLEIAEAISRAGGLALVASAGGRLEPDLKTAGGELIKLPLQTKNPFVALVNAWKLATLARKRNVDIIHARSRAPAWSAFIAAKLTGKPFVTTFHGIYNGRTGPKRFYNSIMTRGDAVIANSHYTREHILEFYDVEPENITVIPRGVDLSVFDPAKVSANEVEITRSDWGLAADDARCVIIAPARLTRWKGQIVLIDAVKMIEARRPGAIKVILAGDPQGRHGYVAELKAAITAAELDDVVLIAGHIAHMPTAFAASDIAVFPVIEAEAFGRGAVEAQAMGVPVIATNLGGYTETVVEGETGFLVPPGAAQALAGALERVIDLGPGKRAEMGSHGRFRVNALYSTVALQTATLAVYQRILRKAKQREAVTKHKPVL